MNWFMLGIIKEKCKKITYSLLNSNLSSLNPLSSPVRNSHSTRSGIDDDNGADISEEELFSIAPNKLPIPQ